MGMIGGELIKTESGIVSVSVTVPRGTGRGIGNGNTKGTVRERRNGRPNASRSEKIVIAGSGKKRTGGGSAAEKESAETAETTGKGTLAGILWMTYGSWCCWFSTFSS